MANKGKERNIINELRQKFEASIEHPVWRRWRDNATRDIKYVEGEQWTAEELKILKERGQPDTVFNEIKLALNRIMGIYNQQNVKMVFRGRNTPDDEAANVASEALLYVLQNNDYKFKESEVVRDGNITGMGMFAVSVKMDDYFQPVIDITADDCLNYYIDPNSRAYDLSDAEFVCRARWMSLSLAKKKYPSVAGKLSNIAGSEVPTGNEDTIRYNHYYDPKNERVRIVECWYKEHEVKKLALVYPYDEKYNPAIGNHVIDVTKWSKSKINKFKKDYPQTNILEKEDVKIKVGVFCGNVLIKHYDSPYTHNMFPFVPYFVYRRRDGEPYSEVRGLISPQDSINKRHSKSLHYLNVNQIIAEEGAFRDEDEARDEANRPDGLLLHKKNYKVEINKNLDLSQGHMALLSASEDYIQRSLPIPAEALGQKSELRSGRALERKELMSITPLATIFKNLSRTRVLLAKMVLELIKQFWTDEKVFYVFDDAGDRSSGRQVVITKEMLERIKSEDYDVIVEEIMDTSTVEDEEFAKITDMLNSFNLPPQMAMMFFPMIVKLSRLRNKDEILQMFDQFRQPPPEQPKLSINLVWNELTPSEKLAFAQAMNNPTLAQAVQVDGGEPATVTKEKAGIVKAKMKADADIQKAEVMSTGKRTEDLLQELEALQYEGNYTET